MQTGQFVSDVFDRCGEWVGGELLIGFCICQMYLSELVVQSLLDDCCTKVLVCRLDDDSRIFPQTFESACLCRSQVGFGLVGGKNLFVGLV